MKIRIADFKGEVPKRSARLLPESYAQIARNTRLETGEIEPLRGRVEVHNFGRETKSFFKDGNTWYGWQGDVDVVPGPIAANRFYFTGDGAPKMRVGGNVYALALPAPADAPDVEVLGDVPADTSDTVLYAYTWVTSLDEESPPSPASVLVVAASTNAVRITGFSTAPVNRLVNRIRIYRSQTGASGVADLYYVDEIPVASTSYDHSPELAPIQNIIPSLDFDPPPANLTHLTALPNGMMVAASGKAIRFCEPYQPHVWPQKYELAVDYPIVGFASFGSSLAVLTTATPYVAQGVTPDSMTLEKMEQELPCLSKNGIVDMGYSAAYPSTEGLVVIGPTGAQLVTQALFTRRQWEALRPETFNASRYAGAYVFGHGPANDRKMALIQIEGGDSHVAQIDMAANAMLNDATTQNLYVIGDTTKVFRFDAPTGAPMKFTYRTRPYHLLTPFNFGAIRVDASPDAQGTLLCRVYADGVLKHTITKAEVNRPARLPSGFLADRWEVEIEATFPVQTISLATSFEELAEA